MGSLSKGVLRWGCFLASFAVLGDVPPAMPDSISFGGLITQSAPDGSGQNGIACFTMAVDGAFDDISLLDRVTTGSGCTVGNEPGANLRIPAANLNSENVAGQANFALTPLDLLEDDSVTDIHSSVNTYSYTGTASVPEPSPLFLLLAPLAWIVLRLRPSRTPYIPTMTGART
jgi:hypothetical protein